MHVIRNSFVRKRKLAKPRNRTALITFCLQNRLSALNKRCRRSVDCIPADNESISERYSIPMTSIIARQQNVTQNMQTKNNLLPLWQATAAIPRYRTFKLLKSTVFRHGEPAQASQAAASTEQPLIPNSRFQLLVHLYVRVLQLA